MLNAYWSSSFMQRLVSALILGPLILVLLFAGGWWFAGLLIVSFLLSSHEWRMMTARLATPALWLGLGLGYFLTAHLTFLFIRMAYVDGAHTILILVLAIWLSDIGGYAFGRIIGGPRLVPVLSPKKTWAGLAGALLGSIIAFFVLAGPLKINLPYIWETSITFSPLFCLIAGAITGLTGQIGDLMISWVKRKAGVKDTSNIIPGHGGVLDRIDSLMLATPVFLLLLTVQG